MNSRTSKQLSRAAVAIAMISVSKARGAHSLSAAERHRRIQKISRTTYVNLKAQWKGLPHTKRARVRRRLLTLTQRTGRALMAGQASS